MPLQLRGKLFVVFLVIYLLFQWVMWGYVIPSQMLAGASVVPYYYAMGVWLGGSLLLPILFIIILWMQKTKQKEA